MGLNLKSETFSYNKYMHPINIEVLKVWMYNKKVDNLLISNFISHSQ